MLTGSEPLETEMLARCGEVMTRSFFHVPASRMSASCCLQRRRGEVKDDEEGACRGSASGALLDAREWRRLSCPFRVCAVVCVHVCVCARARVCVMQKRDRENTVKRRKNVLCSLSFACPPLLSVPGHYYSQHTVAKAPPTHAVFQKRSLPHPSPSPSRFPSGVLDNFDSVLAPGRCRGSERLPPQPAGSGEAQTARGNHGYCSEGAAREKRESVCVRV